MDVLAEVARGRSNRGVGKALSISEEAVKSRRSLIWAERTRDCGVVDHGVADPAPLEGSMTGSKMDSATGDQVPPSAGVPSSPAAPCSRRAAARNR
ncbi:MAG TPA: hypothetical protein VGB19_01670 [Actinomycetota bacterium]|nr:hypothetical protein [Actinomycetota bacterium]